MESFEVELKPLIKLIEETVNLKTNRILLSIKKYLRLDFKFKGPDANDIKLWILINLRNHLLNEQLQDHFSTLTLLGVSDSDINNLLFKFKIMLEEHPSVREYRKSYSALYYSRVNSLMYEDRIIVFKPKDFS